MSQPQYVVLGTAVPDSRAVRARHGNDNLSDRHISTGRTYRKDSKEPHPHAEIVSIDTSAAESLPGVASVITYKDAPDKPISSSAMYLLDNTVRYVGEEVAAVAAETEEIADAAIKLIKVEYSLLPRSLRRTGGDEARRAAIACGRAA